MEGHGWWHLMTGLGAYHYIGDDQLPALGVNKKLTSPVWGIWLRHCLNGKSDQYKLSWPSSFTSIPRIVRDETRQSGTYKKNS